MAAQRDPSPVYYREIQKNAFLKRLPEEVSSSKLKPLVLKKPPIKPLWTVLCVHNGRAPYLEQYRDAVSARCHRPLWRQCLLSARHVTASVTAKGEEYDFLVDTDDGPVRMLAPDWDSMQDWVSTLRSKLIELKIVNASENVYCAPRGPPAPRAAARDPTSPLPPTPHAPPTRVPGIDLTNVTRQPSLPETSEPETEQAATSEAEQEAEPNCDRSTTDSSDLGNTNENDRANISRRNSDRVTEETAVISDSTQLNSQLSSNVPRSENSTPNASKTTSYVARTENSTPKVTPNVVRTENTTPNTVKTDAPNPNTDIDISHWDDFTSLPSTSQLPKKKVAKICGQNICLDESLFKRSREGSDDEFCDIDSDYRQTVLISDEKEASDKPTNITVIQLSNKPPHSAIPIINADTNVFNFDIKNQQFVNVINTESNQYGTVFDSDYGHISLTTTVSLTGDVKDDDRAKHDGSVKHDGTNNEELYERLCLASTDAMSPLTVRRLINQEKARKSSLPNLDGGNSTYEYLFLGHNDQSTTAESTQLTISSNKPTTSSNKAISTNSQVSTISSQSNTAKASTSVNITPKSTITTIVSNSSAVSTNIPISHSHSATLANKVAIAPNIIPIQSNSTPITSNSIPITFNYSNNIQKPSNQNTTSLNHIPTLSNHIPAQSNPCNHTPVLSNHNPTVLNYTPTPSNHAPIPSNPTQTRQINSEVNIIRSHSQNSYDSSPRREVRRPLCENLLANGKIEKETPRPIWKRGLTELSLLTRLRGIGQGKRQDSPTRVNENDRNGVTSPNKVVHRSRPEMRVDGRRRSSSLSNGQSPPHTNLQPLRARQAALLRSEQRRGAALVATIRNMDPPVFVEYNKHVWVSHIGGCRSMVKVGDRVAGVAGVAPRTAIHAKQLCTNTASTHVDILFHRVPLAKIYVVLKKDQEKLGIKLDSECNIISVEVGSPAARAGIPPVGKWAVTEVNNRPINLVKGGEEEMNRLSFHGNEASILIQPSALVKKLRAGVKGHKSILGLR